MISTTKNKIRMGVIGLGGISQVHIRGIQQSPDAQLVAICDIDRDKLADKQQALEMDPALCFEDYRQLIASAQVDAVSICTPNDSHFSITQCAIEHHKPFALEKPVTLHADEAYTLVRQTKEAALAHLVCFSYRFKPAARYARHLIQSGCLGKILHLYGQYNQSWGISPEVPLFWRFIQSRTGTGVLGDLGSHLFDLIRFTVGEIDSCLADSGTLIHQRKLENGQEMGTVDVDDYFHALLRMQGGATGTWTASRFAFGRGNYQCLEIHGDQGALRYNLEQEDALEICYGEPLGRESQFVRLSVPEEFKMDQMQQFFNIYHGRGDGLGATLEDGLAAQRLMEAMMRSASQATFTKV